LRGIAGTIVTVIENVDLFAEEIDIFYQRAHRANHWTARGDGGSTSSRA
jgi:hypothetical protein